MTAIAGRLVPVRWRMVQVDIDLARVESKQLLLTRLGDVLELGGPDGNRPADGWAVGAGWGMNWDALKDCLCCLDSGGIWGSSRKLEFPLILRFTGRLAFAKACPQELATLRSILEYVQQAYEKDGLSLDFQFD